jgi:hypothetical protein
MRSGSGIASVPIVCALLAGRDDSFLRNLFVPDQLLAVNGRNTIGWN